MQQFAAVHLWMILQMVKWMFLAEQLVLWPPTGVMMALSWMERKNVPVEMMGTGLIKLQLVTVFYIQ